MKVLSGIESLERGRAAPPAEPTVVAVGVFDGVHLGHQRLLHELLEMASELRAVPTVVTFRDHPDRLLRGKAPPPLVGVQHRLRLLRRAGVQMVVVLEFDAALRAFSAEQFVERVLLQGLGACGLLLGFDSALGKDREGTPERLAALGATRGFVVRTGTPFLIDGKAISSTAIRAAIAAGQLDEARRLLGRWPSAYGQVVHGDGRGRGLGFPTANVEPQPGILPPNGVYAVQALLDGEQHLGVANLGVRPTVSHDASQQRLEVHLLDWSQDLYGRVLEVCFVSRLRDERKFDGVAALVAQIRADVEAARTALGACGAGGPRA